MSFLTGGSDTPPVAQAPTIPRRSDDAVANNAAEQRRRYSRGGYAATQLTGGLASGMQEQSYTVASKLLGGGKA